MVWKTIGGIFLCPFKTLQEVAEERPIIPAAWVIMIASISWCFGLKLAQDNGAGKVAEFVSHYSAPFALVAGTVFQLNYLFLLIVFPLMALLAWFVRAAILQLSAEILGGMGRGFSLLSTFGLAHAPLIFIFPVAIVAMLVGGGQILFTGDLGSGAGEVIWYSLAIFLHLWTIYAILLSIRATHQMKLMDSIRVVAYPVAAFVVVMLVLKIFIGLTGVSFAGLVDRALGG